MTLYRILVPKCDKNGVKFPLAHHQRWDGEVIKLAGGLTLGGAVQGRYRDTAEEMIPVDVACTEATLQFILRFTKQHYRQEAVLAYVISERVIIWK